MYTATNDNPGQPHIEFGEVKPGIFDTNVNKQKCANVSFNVPVFFTSLLQYVLWLQENGRNN